ncbi:hypothetical protein BC628DRAFT_1144334 [Trametes gibbosa]|nr:hypothetical protein BC628DRAFT_1144334 [Trametes gibbosa]
MLAFFPPFFISFLSFRSCPSACLALASRRPLVLRPSLRSAARLCLWARSRFRDASAAAWFVCAEVSGRTTQGSSASPGRDGTVEIGAGCRDARGARAGLACLRQHVHVAFVLVHPSESSCASLE